MIRDLYFGVRGSGFGIQGSGVRVYGLGFHLKLALLHEKGEVFDQPLFHVPAIIQTFGGRDLVKLDSNRTRHRTRHRT